MWLRLEWWNYQIYISHVQCKRAASTNQMLVIQSGSILLLSNFLYFFRAALEIVIIGCSYTQFSIFRFVHLNWRCHLFPAIVILLLYSSSRELAIIHPNANR